MGRRADYTADEKERALMMLAFCGDKPTEASRKLREMGYTVPKSTILKWKNTDPGSYAELRDRCHREIHSRLAQEFEDSTRRAQMAQDEILEYAHTQTTRATRAANDGDHQAEERHIKLAERGFAAARNAATVAGISNDKARLGREMPYPVAHGTRTADDAIRSLERLFHSVEGTATELPAHQLTNSGQP